MTLIVARKLGSSAVIVGDTHLTNELTKDTVPIWRGMIKSTLLTAEVCLSFAGNSFFAKKALHALPNLASSDRKFILTEHFLQWHQFSKFETDFIIAMHNAAADDEIIQIKDGKATLTTAAWIGSQPGFKMFQGYFSGPDPGVKQWENALKWGATQLPDNDDFTEEHTNLFNRLVASMELVASDSNVPEVGGFTVAIASHNNEYRYMSYARAHTPPIAFDNLRESQAIPFGGVDEGGYAFGLVGSSFSAGNQWIAIYLVQGRLGVMFAQDSSRLLRPNVISGVSPIEFEEVANDKFGVRIGTWFSSTDSIYAHAIQLIEKGNTEEATRWAFEAIQRGPQHADSFKCAGEIFRKIGRHQEALESYTKAVEMAPEDPFLLNKRGITSWKLNQTENALLDFTKAIEISPIFFEAYANRAMLRFKLHLFDSALLDIDAALSLRSGETRMLRGKGAVLAALGRLDEALQVFDLLIANAPGDDDARQNRAKILTNLGSKNEGFK